MGFVAYVDWVVWKLDRLGRSLSHLLSIVNALKAKQVAFRSLTEGMDTTTASGELLLHVFGALAQYERALIQERVVAGLAAAKRRAASARLPSLAKSGRRFWPRSMAVCPRRLFVRNFGVKRTTLIDALKRECYRYSKSPSIG